MVVIASCIDNPTLSPEIKSGLAAKPPKAINSFAPDLTFSDMRTLAAPTMER